MTRPSTRNTSLPAAGAYPAEFFSRQKDGSRRSADVIVPLVLELVRPSSVVDFGCGVGTWLAAFRDLGVSDVLGIDGSYVDLQQLQIPGDVFLAGDLTQPVRAGRPFDLAVSVEVAEHLDSHSAATFVDSLTAAAPVVLFSAACPLQGGDHHVNEQWPSYWEGLFRQRGYVAIDALRSRIWSDNRVEWWYAQNMLVFCHETRLSEYPLLGDAYARTDHARLDVVHPRNYTDNGRLTEYWVPRGSVPQLLRALPTVVRRAVRRRIHQ